MTQSALTRSFIEELYAREERALYNVVYRCLWSRDDAVEVLQEAFVRLWQTRERVALDAARAFVYRVALNLARSRLRWRRVRELAKLPTPQGHPGPEQFAAHSEALAALRDALARLPAKLRDIIVLCELSELSQQEVADALGIPLGTVGSRRHSAMTRLRALLQDPSAQKQESHAD